MADGTKAQDSRWLAYELHDGLLQWVISARMQVESVLAGIQSDADKSPRTIQASELVASQQKLEAARRALLAASDEGRQLIGFIDNAANEPMVNVRSILDRVSEELQVELEGNRQTLEIVGFSEEYWNERPPSDGWNLLRIVQQAVRNAMSHAGPCKIRIEGGKLDNHQWRLRIIDSGVGFEVDEVQASGHFGLYSLRHRAQLLGAKLHIASQPGAGTELVLDIPAH